LFVTGGFGDDNASILCITNSVHTVIFYYCVINCFASQILFLVLHPAVQMICLFIHMDRVNSIYL